MESVVNVKGKYENFQSSKGHGQIVYRGKLVGWEMNYSLEDGSSDIQFFQNKTQAKKQLAKYLS